MNTTRRHLASATIARQLVALVLLPLCISLGACTSRPAPTPSAPIAPEISRAILILRGSDGTAVSYEELLAAACEAEVVIIGENHGHRVGNAWAATLFEDVLEKKSGSTAATPASAAGTSKDADPSRPISQGGWGDAHATSKPALSMEFFERDDQSRLDDYLKGVVDEAAFRKSTSRADGNYPPGHARMVDAAKKHGVPVIAANMPWQYVRFIRGKDYAVLDALTPEQKRLFRIPDAMVEGRYRKDHDELMGPMVDEELSAKKPASHGDAPSTKHVPIDARPISDEERAKMAAEQAAKKKARLDGLFRVMQLWDWTMAESVADALGRVPMSIDAADRADASINAKAPNDAVIASGGIACIDPAEQPPIVIHLDLKPSQSFAPIIHVVGRFHSDFTGGMPQALQSLRPGTKMIIISIVDQSSATLKDDDKGRGDFVVYVGEEAAVGNGL